MVNWAKSAFSSNSRVHPGLCVNVCILACTAYPTAAATTSSDQLESTLLNALMTSGIVCAPTHEGCTSKVLFPWDLAGQINTVHINWTKTMTSSWRDPTQLHTNLLYRHHFVLMLHVCVYINYLCSYVLQGCSVWAMLCYYQFNCHTFCIIHNHRWWAFTVTLPVRRYSVTRATLLAQ